MFQRRAIKSRINTNSVVLYLKRVKGLGGYSGDKRDDFDKSNLFCKAFFFHLLSFLRILFTLLDQMDDQDK